MVWFNYGGKRKSTSILLLSGEERLEGLGRMGTRIHQSPGPLVQLLFLPQFPHLSKWKQNFPSCLRGCGRTAFNKLIWWKKFGERRETGMRDCKDLRWQLHIFVFRQYERWDGAEKMRRLRYIFPWGVYGIYQVPLPIPSIKHIDIFCLDDIWNHESRGMDFLTSGRPFPDHDSGTQIFASRSVLRELKTMHLHWKALPPSPSLQHRGGYTH